MIFSYVIISIVIIADQALKYIIKTNVEFGEKIMILENFLYITYVVNTGAAWSLLQGARWFFVAITIVMIVVLFIYMIKIKHSLFRISAALIIGGGFGNLIDRIISGKVVDFIDMYFWGYDFPVYNIADSCIVIGTILLGLYIIRHEGVKAK